MSSFEQQKATLYFLVLVSDLSHTSTFVFNAVTLLS